MSFQKIAIVGSGQIGSSVAFAALFCNPGMAVICFDNEDNWTAFEERLASQQLAKKQAVDLSYVHYTTNPQAVQNSDLVILATPVGAFAEAIEAISPYVSEKTVFTDVGSTKALSMARIRKALDQHVGHKTAYVPFHILNGKAGSGPSTADADIFKAPGVLVPQQAPAKVEAAVYNFWESLQTRVYKMTAEHHDQILGTTSHLETAIAFALTNTKAVESLLIQRGCADPGNWLQAITRAADADPDMWAGIFRDNRDQILKSAQNFRSAFSSVAEMAAATSHSSIRRFSMLVSEAHCFAHNKNSPNVQAIEVEGGQALYMTTLCGLISVGVAQNASQVERATRQVLSAIANPSFKDGLGPLSTDPESIKRLAWHYGSETGPFVHDFLTQFDAAISLIEKGDEAGIKALVRTASAKRKKLPNVFQPIEKRTPPRLFLAHVSR